jgi:hypothetical protein
MSLEDAIYSQSKKSYIEEVVKQRTYEYFSYKPTADLLETVVGDIPVIVIKDTVKGFIHFTGRYMESGKQLEFYF